MKALSPLPFPGKIRLLFAIFGLFLPGSRTGSQVKGLESKFDKSCFIHTIPGQFPVKKNVIPTLSSFATIDLKENFRKTLTWIFKFGCLFWYHAYIFEENKLDFLIQNLMLNRLTPISNPKKEKGKSSYALFQLLFFILRPVSLNKGFFLFSGPFWAVRNFLPIRSEAEQL